MLPQRFFGVLILIAVVISGGLIVWQRPELLQPRVAMGQANPQPASLPSGCTQAPRDTLPFNLKFDEPTNRLGQITWPVSVGVPFANGILPKLPATSQLTTANEQGVSLPTQMKILGEWREGNQTPKWALLDFQANFGQQATPCVRVHKDRTTTAPVQAVTVTQNDDQISVNTGRVAFTVSKKNFSLFETLTSNGAAVLASSGSSPASSLYWIDQTGKRFEAKSYGTPSVTVETNGPMKAVIKAEGWYAAVGSPNMMRYQVRLTAFAGLPYVRVYHTLIWTERQAYKVAVSNSSTDTWFFESAPGWQTGQEVRITTTLELPGVNPPPGSQTPPLVSTTKPYYVRMLDATTFKLYATAAQAQSDTTPINVVNPGGGSYYLQLPGTTGDENKVPAHILAATTPTMKDFGLQFKTSTVSTQARIGIEGGTTLNQSFPANAPVDHKVEAVQDTYSAGRIMQTGVTTRTINRLSGWAEARNAQQGLAVSVRDLAMQTPKAFTITPNDVSVHLWAPQTGPMSMIAEDRVLQRSEPCTTLPGDRQPCSILIDDGRGGKKIDDQSRVDWETFNPAVSPQGVAKTHEMWVWPTAPTDNPAVANDMVQRPVVAMANPRYQASTNAISGLRAKEDTPEQYRFMEEGLDNMFRQVVTRDERIGDFDMWNFGEVHLFQAFGWRSNDNGGYNWPQTPWRFFYRSGERQYLEEGVRNARHVMDVDVVHDGPLTAPPWEKALGRTHAYSALHWANAPVWDTFWTHPEYLLYNYYLTGYERAADVLKLMAEVPLFPADGADLANYGRSAYGIIHPRYVYYEFTGEQKHLDYAKSWAKGTTDAYNRFGKFPEITFHGFFYRGLEKLYINTRDVAIKDTFMKLVTPFKNATSHFTAPAWSPDLMLPFTFAYRETGDASYLSYPVHRVTQQLLATQTAAESSGPNTWYGGGPGFSSMERLYYPAFIEGALETLGAWKDQGFGQLPAWPGNSVAIASTPATVGSYQSKVTLFTQKPAGVAGDVKLTFALTASALERRAIDATVNKDTDIWTTSGEHRFSNGLAVGVAVYGTSGFQAQGTYGRPAASLPPLISDWRYISVVSPTTFRLHVSHADAVAGQNPMNFIDAGDGRHSFSTLGTIAAIVTDPSGATKTVAAETVPTDPQVRRLPFAASDAAGTYQIDVYANQELFWVTPSTTFEKLVVHTPDQKVSALFGEPGHIYIKPEAGARELTAQVVPANFFQFVPVWLRDLQDRKLGMITYPGSGRTTITLSGTNELLSLQKGQVLFIAQSANVPGIQLTGALPYVSLTPAQWFDPQTAATALTIEAPTAVTVQQGETVTFSVTASGPATITTLTADIANLVGAIFNLRAAPAFQTSALSEEETTIQIESLDFDIEDAPKDIPADKKDTLTPASKESEPVPATAEPTVTATPPPLVENSVSPSPSLSPTPD